MILGLKVFLYHCHLKKTFTTPLYSAYGPGIVILHIIGVLDNMHVYQCAVNGKIDKTKLKLQDPQNTLQWEFNTTKERQFISSSIASWVFIVKETYNFGFKKIKMFQSQENILEQYKSSLRCGSWNDLYHQTFGTKTEFNWKWTKKY